MSRMAKVLFVSHEASRTGAVKLLLDIQAWLRDKVDVEVQTLLLSGGEMEADFASMGSLHRAYVVPSRWTRARRRVTRMARALIESHPSALVNWADVPGHFDIVYANTGVVGQALPFLRPQARTVISHVHEMPQALARYEAADVASMARHTDQFIAVSRAVAQGLESACGVAASRIAIVNGFVSEALLHPRDADTRASVRSELGIQPNAWLLGVCGSGALHKGTDLLPRLAQHLPECVAGAPVHLLHVGQMHPPFRSQDVLRDAQLMGQSHRVHLLPPRADATDVLAALDLHLLPSREDSYPLTVLESAALGVPTVCFADAGGAPEFCEGGYGMVVPYLNVEAMTQACTHLLERPEERAVMAERAKDKVSRQHVAKHVMPQIVLAMGLA